MRIRGGLEPDDVLLRPGAEQLWTFSERLLDLRFR
jgi:hypothetical protein